MYSERSNDKRPATPKPVPSQEAGSVTHPASPTAGLFAQAGPPSHLRLRNLVQRQETQEEPDEALVPEATSDEDEDEEELEEEPIEDSEEVQQSAEGPELSGQDIREAAQQGVQSPSVQLPYARQIQQAFGRHDVSGIKAHVGPEATATARAMNAAAYATGQHVVLAGAPSLHTVAHEAAHVVQQRTGVQLAGGIGKVGDRYEEQADAVADRVVAGQSAEDLLPGPAPAQWSPAVAPIQHEKRGPGSTFRQETRDKILERNKNAHDGFYTCDACGFQHKERTYVKKEGGGRVGDGGFHVDHKVPKSKGGGGNYRNGRVLCGTCNTSRGNRGNVGVTGMNKYGALHRGLITKKYKRRYLNGLKTKAKNKQNG